MGCHLWGHTELDTTDVTQKQQKRKRKGMRNFLKRLQLKISTTWKKKKKKEKKIIKPRGTKNPIQGKSKEKHAKTHTTNQTNKD